MSDVLLERCYALATGEIKDGATIWVLTLEGSQVRCQVTAAPIGPLWLIGAGEIIASRMSSSPILSDDGDAVGEVLTGRGDPGAPNGPHPRIAAHLPNWLVRVT